MADFQLQNYQDFHARLSQNYERLHSVQNAVASVDPWNPHLTMEQMGEMRFHLEMLERELGKCKAENRRLSGEKMALRESY